MHIGIECCALLRCAARSLYNTHTHTKRIYTIILYKSDRFVALLVREFGDAVNTATFAFA